MRLILPAQTSGGKPVLREILLIADKENFSMKSIANAFLTRGVAVRNAGMSFSSLPRPVDCPPVVFLFLDEWSVDRRGVMGEIRDLVQNANALFFVASEQTYFLSDAAKRDLGDRVTDTFARPFNANEIAERVLRFLDEKIASGGLPAPKQTQRAEDRARRVLIVDDDPTSLRALRGVLHNNYKVVMVDSAMSALVYLEDHQPDLILLDYEMPAINGPQFLTMLRAREKLRDIPVMFLTGKSDKDTVMTVMDLKPAGYLLKSTPTDKILEKLSDFFLSNG
ncbi:MAG: response regulator [Lachnospiraceae bacterium]|nr:response regulator [Lachnospiraceae bacterium]